MPDERPVENRLPTQPFMAVPDLPDDLTIGEYAQAVERAGERVVSVIVPAYNDREVLGACFNRVDEALRDSGYEYEILVVDDRSKDGTPAFVRAMGALLPVRLVEKRGPSGRSNSIKEGLDQSTGGIVALLDPDLQFPKDAFREMIGHLRSEGVQIAVANRATYPSMLYALFSKAYRWMFGHVLLAVDADVRSGLKMFRRSLLNSLRFDPEFDSRMGFDAMLLYHARRVGWGIATVRVDYVRPTFHHGLVGAVASRVALAWGIVSLRMSHGFRLFFPFLYPPEPLEYFEAGFTNINDYLFLAPEQSAQGHITREVYFLIFYVVLLVIGYFWLIFLATGRGFAWAIFFHIAVIQLALILFKVYVVWQTYRLKDDPPVPPASVDDPNLPVISVLLPMYKESDIIPQLCARLSAIQYPPDKLDIVFIFESTDTETIKAFQDARPPAHFKALLSPDVQPKTKPKAMNVALKETKGDLLVIFDAEVIPEPDQFLKAVAMFRHDPTLDFLHSKIDVYNSNRNWITKLYTTEFAFFYNFFLPGMATLKSPTPISGHSTYFRREQLIKVGGWDSYNLAEDCDLGIRMFRKGYKNAVVIDSYTWEQSTTTLKDWVHQRTRWMQGFVQTSLVNLRFPALLWKDLGGLRNSLIFMFHVPGGVFLNGLNLIQWGMLIFWYVTRDPIIQTIFSDVLLYISVFSFVVANALFTYFNLLGAFHRKYYSLVKYALLSFIYWLLLSYATMRAIIRFFRQESTWDKTYHPLLPTATKL